MWVSSRSFMLLRYGAEVMYAKNASLSHDLTRSKLAPNFCAYVRSYVGIPLRLVADGTDDIADDFAGGDTRADATRSAQGCREMNRGGMEST
jgi:hypothetical protein